MQKKMIAICIIGMVLLTSIPTLSALEINETTNPIQSLSTANTIYVDDDFDSSTPGWQVDHFDKIQDGIDAAEDGDTVFVFSGIYNETITIDKSINLISENKNTTIINGSHNDDVIKITSSNIFLDGFMIKNGTDFGKAGIKIIECSDPQTKIHISNCSIYNNFKGICIIKSSNIFVFDCTITDSYTIAIDVYDSKENFQIKDCYIGNNGKAGIFFLCQSVIDIPTDIHIYDCNIINNKWDGICFCEGGKNVKIYNNKITNNSWGGIAFNVAINTHIYNNDINDNNEDGISILDHQSGQVHSTNVCIENNRISNNDCGIYLQSCHDNSIYHNRLDKNNKNAYDDGSNIWYNSETEEGNWWSDYKGKDSDGDGIGDIPYNIPGKIIPNKDLYPLGKFKKGKSLDRVMHPALNNILDILVKFLAQHPLLFQILEKLL